MCGSATSRALKGPAPAANEAVAPGARLLATATVRSDGAGRTLTRLVVRDLETRATRDVRSIPGAWALPRPVLGAAPEGLSWDGSVAVMRSLGRPGRFVVVPLSPRKPTRVIDVKAQGVLAFDALSVTGNALFLSEYADAKATVLERIRLYDLPTRTLRRQAVVDKLDGSETMAGVPVARTRSADGKTVYTLYEGARHPFVHLLMTDAVVSLCLDLPASAARSVAAGQWTLTLDSRAGQLRAVSRRLGKVFVIDVRNSIGAVEVTDAAA